ncbi:MAG: hypothetical protein WA718_20210 [Terriglobales bacterium]|jgi:hypothetical protein
MSTTWKSTNQKSKPASNHTIDGTMLSSWSRQQKLAMVVSFGLLALLLALSACSKQSQNPGPVGVFSPAAPSATSMPAPPAAIATSVAPVSTKKTHAPKKRPANVTYSDADAGVSFLYPRRAMLTSGAKADPDLVAVGDVHMNFVQPGGFAVATVALPADSYPGTDFESAFFNVNVNRNLSEQECAHFAFVDSRNADGEAVDAEKVTIGTADMETTSNFSASALKQDEAQYYHSYQNVACYEYVLGMGTEGFGTKAGVEHVDRDQVFAKLEKILATVKVNPPVAHEPSTEPPATSMSGGKE